MTALDAAADDAKAYLKAVSQVVAAFTAMSKESRARLLVWHPTLNDCLVKIEALHNALK